MSAKKPRPCIICGTPTMDRSAQYNDPRCSTWLPCALRRNEGRKRPKPREQIIEQAREAGHPIVFDD